MNDPHLKTGHSLALYVAFPAVAMLLGWGLRGYIGGGPFGAMIPGAFVALCISLLLGLSPRAAAITALFGAVGIGFGGEMTYGQTLGLAKDLDTRLWGLLGVTVKGAVWGLLGGTVLGIGLSGDRYTRKQLIAGFALSLIGFYLGWKLINEPRLIYFSDPINKPRDESWAGLLASALVLLAWDRALNPRAASTAQRFALWGVLGGGLGFGLGTLWLVYGPPNKYIGWWKMMEFSFGAILGAALGFAAWRNRDNLMPADDAESGGKDAWWPALGLLALVLAFFTVPGILSSWFSSTEREVSGPLREILGMLFGFSFFGVVCIVLGLFSIRSAWHAALTITFFHAMLDLSRDMSHDNGFEISTPISLAAVVIATLIFAVGTHRLALSARPVPNLFLWVMWACYAVSCAKTFLHKSYLFPEPGEPGLFRAMAANEPAVILVHTIFTASLLITTWLIPMYFRGDGPRGTSAA